MITLSALDYVISTSIIAALILGWIHNKQPAKLLKKCQVAREDALAAYRKAESIRAEAQDLLIACVDASVSQIKPASAADRQVVPYMAFSLKARLEDGLVHTLAFTEQDMKLALSRGRAADLKLHGFLTDDRA